MIISTTRPTPKSNGCLKPSRTLASGHSRRRFGALFNLVGREACARDWRAVGRGLRSHAPGHAPGYVPDSDSDSGKDKRGANGRGDGSNNPFDPANQRFETHEEPAQRNRKVHQGVWLDCLGSGRCQIRR